MTQQEYKFRDIPLGAFFTIEDMFGVRHKISREYAIFQKISEDEALIVSPSPTMGSLTSYAFEALEILDHLIFKVCDLNKSTTNT